MYLADFCLAPTPAGYDNRCTTKKSILIKVNSSIVLLMNVQPSNLARLISVLGHPFLLMPLLTGVIAYHFLPPQQALIAEVIALGVVIVPAGIYTIARVRAGTWENLDVSNPGDRNQFYGILLPLLTLLAVVALIADVPKAISLGVFAIVALVGTAFAINRWIKISLHTGFAVFVAVTLFSIQSSLGITMLLLAGLVAWSRVVLRRHSFKEVLLGATLGLVIGFAFIGGIRYFS